MLNFVICDDNTNALDKLEQMLNKIFIVQNINATVTYKASNPNDILKYVNDNQVNVLVLDIDLKSSLIFLFPVF